MKNFLAIFSVLLIILFVIIKENSIDRPGQFSGEGCLSCHNNVKSPDPSHPISAFGCHTCHLGNPYSLNKERAHFSMVLNPGDLRVVSLTCGKSACHSDIVPRVKNSIMATNKGIIKTLLSHWPDENNTEDNSSRSAALRNNHPAFSVTDVLDHGTAGSLALDHYSKMCGGCHLWKKRGDRPGEAGRRGGGCSDCHIIDEKIHEEAAGKELIHPRMTTRIPSANCVKCHNRSARIGLSYFGRFESAGYGTPYKGRHLDSRRLSGNRFYMHLEPDIHFSKAQMECVDCHTATGVMGDGKAYDRMEDQLDITCDACHSPKFTEVSDSDPTVRRLVLVNRKITWNGKDKMAVTRKGTPLYNLQKKGKSIIFYRKGDGHSIDMVSEEKEKPYHEMPGHERLSCQACHSAWVPQCYGCHINYKKDEFQRSWLDGRESPGRWKESRSYQRFSKPALGLRNESKVFPASPCQVFVSGTHKSNNYRAEESFRILTMSFFDPHTTSEKSRGCAECHGDPKAVGLGEGLLTLEAGILNFRPTYDAYASGHGMDAPLDGYVNERGEQVQNTSRGEARPFNKEELVKILSVNECLGCHDQYDDKIFHDFRRSKRRFLNEDNLPCRKE
ncbi:hypothetical protein ACFL2O_02600 [Thermodesulfobacteriota bacterium]